MMPVRWSRVAGRLLCASWLGLTVAFFAMITSAGTESLELRIGPLLDLEGRVATLFVWGVIAFGLIMLILFVPLRRAGVIMALAWSAFWALVLSTTLAETPGNSERSVIVLVVALFCCSGWYSWRHRHGSRRQAMTKPSGSR